MAARLAVTALLAVLLAGTALAAPGDPERRAIRKADQAWARRVNLTLRDLPTGFRQGPAQSAGQSGSSFTCERFAPDLSAYTITGQAMSHAFAKTDGTSLFSSAEVFKTVDDERGDWQRTARKQALPCVVQLLEEQSTGSVQLKVTSSSFRQAPRLGDRAVSFRITATISAGGLRAKSWFDIIGVARGRADAALGMLTFRKPPSAALEQSLIAKLADRLNA